MKDHNDKRKDDELHEKAFELTASEKKALEELPKVSVPSWSLEDRVVQTLRERGFLKPYRRRMVELTTWRVAAVAAACVILLATSFMFGQWTGSHRPISDDLILPGGNDFSFAASLQHAGSAYLLALERLTALSDSADGQQAVQGREVALSTLCTAADQTARLVPRSTLVEQLLSALNANSVAWAADWNGDITIEGNRVIEF